MSRRPVVWIYALGSQAQRAQGLLAALGERARCLHLGPHCRQEGALDLGPDCDLALALETAPAAWRPAAAVWLADGDSRPPAGLAGLPCPVLAWGAADRDADGGLPPGPEAAADRVLSAAAAGRSFPWLEGVLVNLPLRDLLGRHQELAASLAVGLEVGLDAQALDGLGPGDLARARELLAGRRLTCHLPFMDLVPGSSDPQAAALSQRRLSAAARWALELGAGQAVAHLGYLPPLHHELEAYCQRLAAALAPAARELAAGGCRLVLENVFELGPRALLKAMEALAQAGVQAGACLDVGHALAFSRRPLELWWDALAPCLWELHLHDNDGQDDCHWPVGAGRADWAMLGNKLRGLESWPLITLEPHREPDLWASLRGLERVWGPPPQAQVWTG